MIKLLEPLVAEKEKENDDNSFPKKSNEAELLTFTVANAGNYNSGIGKPIDQSEWYALQDGTFTWADLPDRTGTLSITSPVATFDAEIEFTASNKAAAYMTDAVGQANTIPSEEDFINESGCTITLENNQFLYIQVISEDGGTVNYYRFDVSITAMGTSVAITSIKVGNVYSRPGTPSSTAAWPTEANWGSVPSSGELTGAVVATPLITNDRKPTIQYGKTTKPANGAPTPPETFAASLSGPFVNGDLIYILVTSESGLNTARYIIVIAVPYTVTFNKNGGDTEANPATKTVTAPATTVVTLPTPPTRGGYTFTGWNTQANGSGTAFAEATAVTGSITVYAQWNHVPVSGVSLNKDTLTLTVGETETFIATVSPSDALKTVTWTSSDPGKVGVDQTGKVTAIAAGTAVITVTTVDGGKTAQCTVSVNNIAAGIVINLGNSEWNLVTQTAQADANTNRIFTVSGTGYTAYQWYLDGAPVGTSASYTFNRNFGVYELMVVVTNNAGEKRSGSCRVTVR